MWVRLAVGEDKKDLVRIRENDLFDIAGMAGDPTEGSGSRFDVVDHTFVAGQRSEPHPVPDGDGIGTPAMSFQAATEGRDDRIGTIVKDHLVPEAVGTDNDTRKGARRRVDRVHPVVPPGAAVGFRRLRWRLGECT